MSLLGFMALIIIFILVIAIFCDACVIQAGNHDHKLREDDEIQAAWCTRYRYNEEKEDTLNHEE